MSSCGARTGSGVRFSALIALWCCLPVLLCAPLLQAREALPVSGKRELYQRVLTRPGAMPKATPGTDADVGSELPALTPLYVYDRKLADEASGAEDWLEVGSGRKDAVLGWLPAGMLVPWNQTLTLAFTRTADRAPTLFFRDADTLRMLLESETLLRDLDRFREQIRTGDIPADFPVIAEEPGTYVDPNREFYLLPILEHEEVYLESGHRTTLLDVAAVTLQAGAQDLLRTRSDTGPNVAAVPESVASPALASTGRDTVAYRAGVVFVIDTTASMQPYIERTRAAIRRMYDRLRESDLGDALSFGVVAFRDNTAAAPGLEYVSRVVATLEDGRDAEGFFAKVDKVSATSVSSKGFREDAFSGIHEAIEAIDWQGYGGRFIVLITDASARDADDALSRYKLGAERLRLLAQDQDQRSGGAKIAIAALHLLTADGRQTHEQAARQYRELTRWGDAGDLYFPVPDGNLTVFGAQVDALSEALLNQLEAIRGGEVVQAPEPGGGDSGEEIARKAALVGRAMQLAYLGRETGSRAPRLIHAAVSDRDPAEPAVKSLEVRVMISKLQLSNLQETLQAIFAAGEQTTLSAQDFFSQLRGAAAALARDPERVNSVQVKRLADVGLVGEWLDELPYTSQIMNLTESRWLSRAYAEQQEVLDAIEEKIRLYRLIHDDTDRWVDLGGAGGKGEAVTTIPLDALP